MNQELVALDADMHYELADYLKEQRESKEIDMWGFNLWLENQTMDEILEYDFFTNIHNNQLHGFPRGGMGILDSDPEKKICFLKKQYSILNLQWKIAKMPMCYLNC